MSTIGNNIARIRKEMGLTQEELAKMMGYKSKSTINKIELGINDIPQSKIVQFASVLGTTPAELMGWEVEEMNSSPSESKLTEGEQKLLESYRRLSSDSQKLLVESIDSFDSLSEEKQQLALQMLRFVLGNQ